VVTISGTILNVDGKRFAIKGMNYSPVPIGTYPGNIPYGDYFVPNYENVWKPDIDKIREAGVNVIKLYAGNPDLNAGAPGSAGNWKDFLDYCWNGGTNPIYVVMFSYTEGNVIAGGGTGLNDYSKQYEELVKSTVKHPAVFGYLIGNEIFRGVTQNPQFWINFGKLIDAAKSAGSARARNHSSQLRPRTISRSKRLGRPSNLAKSRARSKILTHGPSISTAGPSWADSVTHLLSSTRI
jgi:hypothetical protein